MSASIPPPAARPWRRAVVFAHHDRHGCFDAHVRHALTAYREVAERLVVVSNAARRLPAELAPLVDTFIGRDNVGYDFGAWRAGLARLDRGALDEIVCVNDSVYGPLFDLAPALTAPRVAAADLWGMVVSAQPAARGAAPVRHVQSWFLAMRRRLLDAPLFDRFWESVEPLPTKADVIARYEVGLSAQVAAAGLTIAGLYDATSAGPVTLAEVWPHLSARAPRRSWRLWRKSRRPVHNPSELVWWRLLAAGVPYVKVGLFRTNHYGLDVARVLADLGRRTPYDPGLIRAHLARCA